jgi:transposase
MAKRKFTLTDKARRELQQAYELSKEIGARTRYQSVRLYGEGYAVTEIEKITGCRRSSLMEWCREYQHNGAAGLVDKRVGGNSAKLSKLQIEDLSYRLRQYTPRDLFGSEASTYWTAPDLSQVIKKWYGVEYRSPSSYLRLFGVCDFSYQKVEKVYKSRNELKALDFEEQVEKN